MKTRARACAAVMLAALAAVMLGGCVFIGGNGLVGNGQMKTEERNIEGALTGVINRTSFDVVIDSQLEGKAVIEGESNLIEFVELFRDGAGVLNVGIRPGTSITRLRRMTVRIPAVSGGVIRTEGSGNITLAAGTLEGESFDVGASGSGDVCLKISAKDLALTISGSGNMDIDADADTLTATIGGSGDISIKGNAGQLSVSSGGSGGFEGFGLKAGDADVRLSGSGDASVTVSGSLTGSISGSGDIVYGGNPESVSVSDNASGDLHAR